MAELVAVYSEERAAQRVAQQLQGTLTGAVVVNDDDDHETSIRAEMEAEVDEAWASPGIGALLTAEQMRGAVLVSLAGGAVGAVLGLPLSLLFTTSWVLAWKLGIGVLIGALFGAVVGALLGGGFAMQSTMHPPAAQVGYTVRVSPASKRAAQLMADARPVRIDRLVEGRRVATPVTDGPDGMFENVRDTAEKLAAHSADERLR